MTPHPTEKTDAIGDIITVCGERRKIVYEERVLVTPKEGAPYEYTVIGTSRA